MKHIVLYNKTEKETDDFNIIRTVCGAFNPFNLYEKDFPGVKDFLHHINILNTLFIHPEIIQGVFETSDIYKNTDIIDRYKICKKCIENEHIKRYMPDKGLLINNIKPEKNKIHYMLKYEMHKVDLMSRVLNGLGVWKEGGADKMDEVEATIDDKNKTSSVSNKDLVYHQKLEPNYCEIASDNEGRITFKVNSHGQDIRTAIESAVESYNKIAKVINRPLIDLNTVVGSQSSEILTKKNEEKLALENWEASANVNRPKGKFVNNKYFGNKLRKMRKGRGITIYKMAEDLGIAKEVLLKFELSKLIFKEKSFLIEIFEYLNLGETSMSALEKSWNESLKVVPSIALKSKTQN